jgi:hypothetical protein
MQITIPKHVNANGLIDLLHLLAAAHQSEDLVIDFTELRKITPAGLVALTAWLNYRNHNHYSTDTSSIHQCPIVNYLKRMNLFSCCELDSGEENFSRHSSGGRFVPLTPIPVNTGELGESIANIIAPGGDEYDHPNMGLWDASYYLITELANNVRQHSQRNGFISAQATQKDGFIRIALADSGIGIKRSLADGGYPWAHTETDAECITRALTARVSSKGQPANEGVGLTLSSRVVHLMGGRMLIASGNGIITTNDEGNCSILESPSYTGMPGTIVTVAFQKPNADNFDSHLQQAKELEHLLQSAHSSATFTP